jgi:hypothetical protein
MRPNLDDWLPNPGVRVTHRRESDVEPGRLWEAARHLRLADAALLGRLVRWRIPGTRNDISFEELFQNPPFIVLEDNGDDALISGLVGRIWTLRRDYPRLADPEEFRTWSKRGTARVVMANWIEPVGNGQTALVSEVRVEPIGSQGRVGLAAVRPLVTAFQHLIGSDGIDSAVRLAERDSSPLAPGANHLRHARSH